MVKYTAFIPKEFFLQELSSVQIILVAIIILAVIVFLGYKFYKATNIRRKEESF